MKNVILITLDSWRADHFSEEITPNIFKLASNACVFENAFSCGQSSSFSFPGIIASIYASTFNRHISPAQPTVDKMLKRQGYWTAAIHSDVVYLDPLFGYYDTVDFYKHTGFDDSSQRAVSSTQVVDPVADGAARFGLPELPMQDLVSAVYEFCGRNRLDYLERLLKTALNVRNWRQGRAQFEKDQSLHLGYVSFAHRFMREAFRSPGFVHFHSVIPHPIYCMPDHIREKYGVAREDLYKMPIWMRSGIHTKSQKRKIRAMYKGAVGYADEFVAGIIRILEDRAMLANSIIVITADHGDSLLERGYYGHSKPFHSYDNVLKVPLIIYDGDLGPTRIANAVSLIDVPPTLAALCGIECPKDFQGVNLLPLINNPNRADDTINGRFLFTEAWHLYHPLDTEDCDASPIKCYTVRGPECKLKVNVDFDRQWSELYNWKEDPQESRDISKRFPQVVRDMETSLQVHVDKQSKKRLALSKRSNLSRHVKASLREHREQSPGPV